jgi:hypothetical protein
MGSVKRKHRAKLTAGAAHSKTDHPPVSSSRLEAGKLPSIQSEAELAVAREAAAAKAAAQQVEVDRLASKKVAAEKAETDRSERVSAAKAAAERAATDAARPREEALIERTKSAGAQYAKDSGTEWKLIESLNETNGRTMMSVESIQQNASGELVHVTGRCERSTAYFFGLTLDAEGKGIEFIGRSRAGEVSAQLQVNDGEPKSVMLTTMELPNNVKLAAAISENSRSDFVEIASAIVSGNYFDIKRTWRVIIEMKTARGPLVVKIPTYDPNVQQFIESCIAKQ